MQDVHSGGGPGNFGLAGVGPKHTPKLQVATNSPREIHVGTKAEMRFE